MSRFHQISVLILLLAAFCVAMPTYGQSKKQLENEKSKLEKEIKRLNNELAGAKKNTKLNAAQLKALNQKIDERTKLINNLGSQIQMLDQQIGQTQDSISMMKSHIDSMKVEYAKVVNAMYRSQMNLNKQGLVFDNKGYNRSFLKLKCYKDYSEYRKKQAAEIAMCQEELQAAAEQLGQQRAEQSNLLLKENQNKALLAKEQEQKQQSLNASKKQEQALSKQISQKEKQRQQLQKQIQKIVNEEIAKARREEAARKEAARKEAERKAAASGKTTTTTTTSNTTSTKPAATASTSKPAANESPESAEFSAVKGRLPWPVSYKSVVREYGKYTHASGGVNMNNGLDLSCAAGTTVICVANGKVTRVFTTPTGAKGVIVRHGDYMTVYANMQTVSVKEGSKVNARQTLGTVWNGDGSGTAEFSFQIWNDRNSMNPRAWLR
ncbi:MAG: peptidoglycan DD-metalloendopeptidase family protein [Bacteroidales bacterium]|nr:peptidoglycan DD-metalloendopeptidase family protein [Bacteroidales bacterium]